MLLVLRRRRRPASGKRRAPGSVRPSHMWKFSLLLKTSSLWRDAIKDATPSFFPQAPIRRYHQKLSVRSPHRHAPHPSSRWRCHLRPHRRGCAAWTLAPGPGPASAGSLERGLPSRPAFPFGIGRPSPPAPAEQRSAMPAHQDQRAERAAPARRRKGTRWSVVSQFECTDLNVLGSFLLQVG